VKISERKVVEVPQRVLLCKQGKVVLTHNHSDTGELLAIVASLLMNELDKETFIAGVCLYPELAAINKKLHNQVEGWKCRIITPRLSRGAEKNLKSFGGGLYVEYFALDIRATRIKRKPRRKITVLNLDLLYRNPAKEPLHQLEQALAYLEICNHRGIKPGTKIGATASKLLTASPQWDRFRRSAPAWCNEESRKRLPGNHYSINTRYAEGLKTVASCFYLDQENSHHCIAEQIDLPHPQNIKARGKWKRGEGFWIKPTQDIGVGLVLAKIQVGHMAPTKSHLYPKWAQKRGTRLQWLWTPELRLFDIDYRLQLEYFVCAYTNLKTDPVLREYGQWAIKELQRVPERESYKKGPLLAAYGVLAYNPEKPRGSVFWGAHLSDAWYRKQTKLQLPFAGEVAHKQIKSNNWIPPATNVLARGVIEAECLTRTIEYAKELDSEGYDIAHIYADGFFVVADQLPFIRDGWRIKGERKNHHIVHPNTYINDKERKFPGIPEGATREEIENREKLRQSAMSVLVK
jgi:hypothetical protein